VQHPYAQFFLLIEQSSWNLSAPPQREVPGTGWGDYTKEGIDAAPYQKFTDFANLMYSNEQAEEWYKAHIKTVMSRRNTVNGHLYTEDPAIMTWQLANEPQAAGAASVLNPKDQLFPWVERISNYIRTMAPKQLINVGFESKQGEYYFKQVHNFPNVDYTTTHCWVQNWGVYDMVSIYGSGSLQGIH
jgi:mannan endo-1,4-beta-mannosidase